MTDKLALDAGRFNKSDPDFSASYGLRAAS